MKNKLIKKLRSSRGDSIAEVLIALLISVVALVMLAAMIASSTRLIQQSRTAIEKYDAANNALATMADGSASGNGKLIVKAGGNTVKLTGSDPTDGIAVKFYESKVFGDKKVVAYKKG